MNQGPITEAKSRSTALAAVPVGTFMPYGSNHQLTHLLSLIMGDQSLMRLLDEISTRSHLDPATPPARLIAGINDLVEGRIDPAKANLKWVVESSRGTDISGMAGLYLKIAESAQDYGTSN